MASVSDGIGLGIDFGTTNSTVCLFDGERFRTIALEGERTTMPTLLYVDREYRPSYGEAARERFIRDNEGRRIRLESYEVGTIEITLGDNAFESFDHTGFNPAPTSYDATVSGVTDRNLPGFLFAGTKRMLGQSIVDSVQIFGRQFRLEAVVSSIVQHLLRQVGAGRRSICVGRPVNYECADGESRDGCNDLALERMRRALGYAGLTEYAFFLEPIAPVLAWMHEASPPAGTPAVPEPERGNDADPGPVETLLVLDFGGGTLDLSLIARRGRHLAVHGNDGYALGGDIITERLIRDHLLPLLGLDPATLDELRRAHHDLDDLVPHVLNWRTTYLLNQPAYLGKLAAAIAAVPAHAQALNRARLLIVRNYSYQLFHAVDTAKQQLTDHPTARIRLPAVRIDLELTRDHLERSLEPYLATVVDAIRGFCGGVDAIDRVLLTGGTSLIPAIRARIGSIFPDRVVGIDPFMSIVKGFALAAWLGGHGRLSETGGRLEIDL